MILRHYFNWIFPPFKPLDLALIAVLKERLSSEARSVLEKQVSAANLVQHNFGEVMLYEVGISKLVKEKTAPFPVGELELHLATASVSISGKPKPFRVEYYLVKESLFSIEVKPNPKGLWKTSEVKVLKFTLHHDPMKPARDIPKVRVFVAMGSNLGDSAGQIQEAMNWLEGSSSAPLRRSSLWRTSPVDCPPNSLPFINAVVELTVPATESPEPFLEKLRELEREFGRAPKKVLNEPRSLDLDLIAFGNEVCKSPELTLPHPRAHARRFVLQPLSEIAPELVLPGQGKTVAELLAELPADETVTRI
jgi:2-amino-4-hydroxy-6-hydroxymethyldihydropteridine diphosphokinase